MDKGGLNLATEGSVFGHRGEHFWSLTKRYAGCGGEFYLTQRCGEAEGAEIVRIGGFCLTRRCGGAEGVGEILAAKNAEIAKGILELGFHPRPSIPNNRLLFTSAKSRFQISFALSAFFAANMPPRLSRRGN